MVSSTCETIQVGSYLLPAGFVVKVVSNSQSLKATCVAMAATYYWALWRKAADGNGKMNADGYVVEVWHVER
jgi:hypothetical protein